MKITDIQILRMDLPTDRWMMLVIETDQGLAGWGEITESCDDFGLAGILTGLRESLVGKDPLCIQECRRCLSKWTYPVLGSIRVYATALSGVDQALWDLAAKYYKTPLYCLYGAAGKKEIPLYANLNRAIRSDRSPEALARQGRMAVQAGFTMVKCTPFDEINPTVASPDPGKAFERMDALLGEVPIEKVSIDCHQRFTRYSLGRAVEHILKRYGNPYWIEDPVPVLDYRTIRQMNEAYPFIRWAAGEDALNLKQILTTMESGCYDVIMPDVKYIGGPGAVKALIPTVEGYGLKITLHNPSGIIATAHSAHLTALCENPLPMEFPFGAVADRHLLAGPQEIVKDGVYRFSGEPGIGVEISQEALKEYGFRFTGGRWENYHG